jgi:hypothetical protein
VNKLVGLQFSELVAHLLLLLLLLLLLVCIHAFMLHVAGSSVHTWT